MSDFAYPLHEECGVFGIYDRAGTEDVAAAAYSALYALQHRGQESCGIAVNDDGVINGHRDLGLVNEVFTPAVLASLANPNAHMATGHVRIGVGKACQHRRGEYLVHKAEVAVADNDAVIVHSDAAALLTTVLQSIQGRVGGSGHILGTGTVIDAENTAFFVQWI